MIFLTPSLLTSNLVLLLLFSINCRLNLEQVLDLYTKFLNNFRIYFRLVIKFICSLLFSVKSSWDNLKCVHSCIFTSRHNISLIVTISHTWRTLRHKLKSLLAQSTKLLATNRNTESSWDTGTPWASTATLSNNPMSFILVAEQHTQRP